MLKYPATFIQEEWDKKDRDLLDAYFNSIVDDPEDFYLTTPFNRCVKCAVIREEFIKGDLYKLYLLFYTGDYVERKTDPLTILVIKAHRKKYTGEYGYDYHYTYPKVLDCDDARATQFEDLQEIVDSVAEADVEQLQFAKHFNKIMWGEVGRIINQEEENYFRNIHDMCYRMEVIAEVEEGMKAWRNETVTYIYAVPVHRAFRNRILPYNAYVIGVQNDKVFDERLGKIHRYAPFKYAFYDADDPLLDDMREQMENARKKIESEEL